jgi:hypothetical protein
MERRRGLRKRIHTRGIRLWVWFPLSPREREGEKVQEVRKRESEQRGRKQTYREGDEQYQ